MVKNKLQSLLKKPDPEPTAALAWARAEDLIDELVRIGFILEDTKDWDKMDEQVSAIRLAETKKYYADSMYKLESLRDELLLIKQEVTSYENFRNIQKTISEQSGEVAGSNTVH